MFLTGGDEFLGHASYLSIRFTNGLMSLEIKLTFYKVKQSPGVAQRVPGS